jgi:hypothetical protein
MGNISLNALGVETPPPPSPPKEVAHMSNSLFGLEKFHQKEKLLTKTQMRHFWGFFNSQN